MYLSDTERRIFDELTRPVKPRFGMTLKGQEKGLVGSIFITSFPLMTNALVVIILLSAGNIYHLQQNWMHGIVQLMCGATIAVTLMLLYRYFRRGYATVALGTIVFWTIIVGVLAMLISAYIPVIL
jgi:hypothetical protein